MTPRTGNGPSVIRAEPGDPPGPGSHPRRVPAQAAGNPTEPGTHGLTAGQEMTVAAWTYGTSAERIAAAIARKIISGEVTELPEAAACGISRQRMYGIRRMLGRLGLVERDDAGRYRITAGQADRRTG